MKEEKCQPQYKPVPSSLKSSVPQRPARRKRREKFLQKSSHNNLTADESTLQCFKPRDLQQLLKTPESIYSTIDDLHNSSVSSKDLKSLNEHVFKAQKNVLPAPGNIPEKEDTKKENENFERKEPIYATVDKDYKRLLKKITELREENVFLKNREQSIIQEEKLKEETLHSKLQLQITQLEAATRKEVNALSERIQSLLEEREAYNEQLEIVDSEKRQLASKCEELSKKIVTMIDKEKHAKIVEKYNKLLEESKQEHAKEVDEMEEKLSTLQNTTEFLSDNLRTSTSNCAKLRSEVESLTTEKERLANDCERLEQVVDSARNMVHENQTFLLSLLKMAENLVVERDVLLNKSSFQEGVQRELYTSMLKYTLDIGRLEEHFKLGTQKMYEGLKLEHSKTHSIERIHKDYEHQLDLLRQKILQQHNKILQLECTNKKLEAQLQQYWES